MRRQRGIAVWVYIVGILAILGAVGGLGLAIDSRGYNRGASEEKAAWQGREARELAAANAEIQRLTAEVAATERQHAERLNAVSGGYQEALRDAKRKHDSAIASIRSGVVRLRDPGATTACKSSVTRGTGEAPAGASGRDGAQGGELSGSASEFLYGLAAEADQIVHQLTACQKIVRSDRMPDLKPVANSRNLLQ